MYTGILGKIEIQKVQRDTSGNIVLNSGNPAILPLKELAYISNWSIEDTTDMIEVTRLGMYMPNKSPVSVPLKTHGTFLPLSLNEEITEVLSKRMSGT